MKSLMRRTRPQSEEKSPIWLVVLCDMMTILMLFFLMMFSFTYQPEKGREFARTFAVDEIIQPPDKILPDEPVRKPPPDTAEDLRRLLREKGLKDAVEVYETETSIRIRLRESILFETAGARLDPRAGRTLGILAGVLNELPNEVVIEGHTDNVPITKAHFRSNWELSVARSYAVIERLIGEGVKPERLIASGYGEYHPVASNVGQEDRARNRRVEIVILRAGAEG